MDDKITQLSVRDDEGAFHPDFVRAVSEALEKNEGELRALVLDLHQSDLADLLELLKPAKRSILIKTLGQDFDMNALTELDEQVRDQVIEDLPNEQVAEAVRLLDSDDAVYLLEDLEESERSDILAKIPEMERAALQRSLNYPEDSAGRMMQTDFIAVPPFWSVGQTIDYMRDTDNLPNSFAELFVVDPAYHPIGTVPIDRLLRSKRPVLMSDIADSDLHILAIDEDQEEVALQFERYNLISTPVVAEDQRLVGIITVDDVVEVIQEEAEEDIHRLGGVGDESLTNTVLRTTRGRFSWLFFNLLTAIVASIIISLFDRTIEELVALAILMPIVASMGGNAGTQTMTVAVRALATRDLNAVNALRIIVREGLVGLLNGLLFAAFVGGISYIWFANAELGMVIAAAMLFNMVIAGLSGILIPLTLDRMDIDPAIASSVFVTTVTDVVGFLAFLGLAALWLV